MRQSLRVLCVACLITLVVGTGRAQALPVLQLDILGGQYDPVTKTIVSSGPSFTLVALLTPHGGPLGEIAALLETYYISAAITPQIGPTDTDIGSFTVDGNEYDATGDMTYGTPPLEGLHGGTDSGDLAPHSVYPTFFKEFSFSFSPLLRTEAYNSQDNPGGLTPTRNWTGSYYRTFQISTSLAGSYNLHFDLYDTYMKGCLARRSCGPLLDEDIDRFAPFSHDAESRGGDNPPVPEPATLTLLGVALAGGAVRRWRQVRQ